MRKNLRKKIQEECGNIEWEQDMGAHIPFCKLDGKICNMQCTSVHGAADHIVRFQSTMADVIYAEYCLNKRFTAHAMASVYDFFELLDILDQCRSDYDKLGWDVDRMIEDYSDDQYRECLWIEFYHRWFVDEKTGETIMSIDYVTPPDYDPECGTYTFPFEWNEIHAYNYPRE